MRYLLATAMVLVSVATASAENRWMQIANETGITMMEFQASNQGSNSWGRDWLGSQVIGSGYYMDMNFDDGSGYCIWDFRASFADGDIVESRGVNVCVESNWTFY